MKNIFEALVKWEHCVQLIMERTRRFPKILRPTLGRRLDEQCIESLVILSDARYLPKDQKQSSYQKVDSSLATIRVLIRLARAQEALSSAQYQHLSEKINEVGRMIGGMQRLPVASDLDPEPKQFKPSVDP